MQDMTIIFPQKICKLQADLLFLWSDDVVCVFFLLLKKYVAFMWSILNF